MNMFLMKWACQATSMMKRIAMRVSLLVPQKASTTNRRLLDSSFTASSFTAAQVASEAGWLSFLNSSEVHQTVSLLFSSMTMNLSFGERPVYTPVMTFTAPSSETCPLSKPSSSGLVSSSNRNS